MMMMIKNTILKGDTVKKRMMNIINFPSVANHHPLLCRLEDHLGHVVHHQPTCLAVHDDHPKNPSHGHNG
jgi:hypothetical protein